MNYNYTPECNLPTIIKMYSPLFQSIFTHVIIKYCQINQNSKFNSFSARFSSPKLNQITHLAA